MAENGNKIFNETSFILNQVDKDIYSLLLTSFSTKRLRNKLGKA